MLCVTIFKTNFCISRITNMEHREMRQIKYVLAAITVLMMATPVSADNYSNNTYRSWGACQNELARILFEDGPQPHVSILRGRGRNDYGVRPYCVQSGDVWVVYFPLGRDGYETFD